MRIVALIPARAGSKRVPGKNTKLLGGKPLIQWTIDAARESGAFASITACTDDLRVAETVCGTPVPLIWRSQVSDEQPDIVWVRSSLEYLPDADAFAILRPTSPFRTASTIRRAVQQFKDSKGSSIRAVERVKQHPGKMWSPTESANKIVPLLQPSDAPVPWHSSPTQSLPTVYVQNSSLEIAWRWCVDIFDSISGPKVAPFFTEGMEGFSIDYPDDWERAERYVAHLQETAAAE